MKVGVNYSKYVNGMQSLRKTKQTGVPVKNDEERIEQQNREKEICLNCTKKKCRGTKKCFEKERNKND